MKITWIGHACFKIEDQDDVIIIDPYENNSVPGLKDIHESCTCVLCSHQHHDHCGTQGITIVKDKNYHINKIKTYHDHHQGSHRGYNIIHDIELNGYHIVHLGDLGCMLMHNQIEQLKDADILLIPIGGYYTIDANEALEVIHQLKPKHAIVMHYSGDGFGYDEISTLDTLKNIADIEYLNSTSIELPVSFQTQILALKPQNM